MMQGKPTICCTFHASSMLWAMPARGHSRPMLFMAMSKRRRSSALSMASAVAPIISTPNSASTPCFSRSSAQLSAVWPPMVGSTASGRSFLMISRTTSQVMGSM
ncbi:hypothetical protein D3C78_960770 [compost metagenome]